MAGVALTTATAYIFDDADRGGYLATAFVIGMLGGTPLSTRVTRHVAPKVVLTAQLGITTLMWALLTICALTQASWVYWILCAVGAGVPLPGPAV